MTDGMKSGAGSDPFSEDSTSEKESSDDNDTQDSESQVSSESEPASATKTPPNKSEATDTGFSNNKGSLPYIFRRNGVKDDRKMIQYFLRDDTEDVESDAKHAVEEELGTDVYLTDLREALVRVGAEHVDEVAEELREWGYRYHEE